MSRNTIIIVSVAVFGVLLATGLGVFYFSGKSEPEPQPEATEEKRNIDYTTRFDDIVVSDIQLQDAQSEEADAAEVEQNESGQEISDESFSDGLINQLSDVIFDNYLPSADSGNLSRMITFKQVNMYFATDLSQFSVDQEDDILKVRQEVLKFVLDPVIISRTADYFGKKLLDRLNYLAENRTKNIPSAQGYEERLLTQGETEEMLRLFSIRLTYLAHVFEQTVNDERVISLIKDYLSIIDNLRDVYFEYWQLDDDSPDEDRERLSERIKSLITQRENVRERVMTRVADADMRQAGHDYVYEAQWVYRRIEKDGFSKESIISLAQAGRSLAEQALVRAQDIAD